MLDFKMILLILIISIPSYSEGVQSSHKTAYCKEIDEYKQELQKMYSQLNAFRNTKEFKEYGFAVNGKYNYWLKSVTKTKDELLTLVRQDFNKYDIIYTAFSRLEQLGLEYLSSRAKASTIKWMKDDINAGLVFNCQN